MQQTPILIDDGKSGTVAVLTGAKDLDANTLSAQLTLSSATAASPGAAPTAGASAQIPLPIILPASSVALKNSGRDVAISFPSLVASGIAEKSEAGRVMMAGSQTASATITLINGAGAKILNGQAENFQAIYIKRESSPTADFVMVHDTDNIDMDAKGEGKVVIRFAKVTKTLEVTVKGADAGFPAGIVPGKSGKYEVKSDGSLTLALSNLSPYKNVIIEATEPESHTTVQAVFSITPLPPGT